MGKWGSAGQLVRDDDPYHAWAFEIEKSRGEPTPLGHCLVVLELKCDSDCQALLDAIFAFGDQYLGFDGNTFSDRNASFLLTASDCRHFEKSLRAFHILAESEKKSVPQNTPELAQKTAYERLFLAYATEDFLFGERKQEIWDKDHPLFRIHFAGRATRSADLGETESRDLVRPKSVEGVMLAVIDDSIAFLNEEFSQKTDNIRTSLFSEIWFQDKMYADGHSSSAGARLAHREIDTLLAEVDKSSEAEVYCQPIKNKAGQSFRPLDWSSPDHQPLAFPVSHGTHVVSTALRSFRKYADHVECGASGTNLDAKLNLFGVTVPSFVTQDTSGSSIGSYLIAALVQVFRWNDELSSQRDVGPDPTPLVISCSYGSLAGPKDGSGRLNRVIELLLKARNDRGFPTSLVVPMGNGRQERTVAEKIIPNGQSLDLDWLVLPDDGTPSFLELYAKGEGGAGFRIELSPPQGECDTFSENVNDLDKHQARYLLNEGRPSASISLWPTDNESQWTHRVFVALGPTKTDDPMIATVPHGRWRFRVTNEGNEPLHVIAMIQRDDTPGTYPVVGRQSYFDSKENWDSSGVFQPGGPAVNGAPGPITTRYTASTFASIDSPFVVVAGAGKGEYGDSQDQQPHQASPYSALGPRNVHTQDLLNPDFTTLVDRSDMFPGRYAAGTYSGTDVLMSGSSVAAPMVAGYLAAHPELIGRDHRDLTEETISGMGKLIACG